MHAVQIFKIGFKTLNSHNFEIFRLLLRTIFQFAKETEGAAAIISDFIKIDML